MNFMSGRGASFRKRRCALLAAFLVLLSLGCNVSADPASTLQTLMIVDQGDFLSFQWSFYYVDFPPRFDLKEKQGKTIVLDQSPAIYENISDIISVAFDLHIDGKAIQPEKIAGLTVSPNKVCTVTLLFRGKRGGHLEIRAPVLHYLPATAMINYEIVPLGHAEKVVTGNLVAHQGTFPTTIVYEETGSVNHSLPVTNSKAIVLFKSELRTAWVNSNWLLMSIILLAVAKPRRSFTAVALIAAEWAILCFSTGSPHLKLHWEIPEILLGIPIFLLGVMGAKRPGNWHWIVLIAIGAGIPNTCHDLQQIRWAGGEQTTQNLMGATFGFACGLLGVILVLALLLQECKKFPQFERLWVGRICWFSGILALALPIQKMFLR